MDSQNHAEIPIAHRIPDACRRIGVGRTTFYELLRRRLLVPIRVGHRVLVPESELQRLVATRLATAQAQRAVQPEGASRAPG